MPLLNMIKEQFSAFEGKGQKIRFPCGFEVFIIISTPGNNALIFLLVFWKVYYMFPPFGMHMIVLSELMKHAEGKYNSQYKSPAAEKPQTGIYL